VSLEVESRHGAQAPTDPVPTSHALAPQQCTSAAASRPRVPDFHLARLLDARSPRRSTPQAAPTLSVHQRIFFGEISQKTDFVRPEADILSQIPRFSVDEFSKEDEKYG
jgi:hypothetical protein